MYILGLKRVLLYSFTTASHRWIALLLISRGFAPFSCALERIAPILDCLKVQD